MNNIFDNELKNLMGAINILQQITVAGPFQGAHLAKVHDTLVAVANSLKKRGTPPTQIDKDNAQDMSALERLDDKESAGLNGC